MLVCFGCSIREAHNHQEYPWVMCTSCTLVAQYTVALLEFSKPALHVQFLCKGHKYIKHSPHARVTNRNEVSVTNHARIPLYKCLSSHTSATSTTSKINTTSPRSHTYTLTQNYHLHPILICGKNVHVQASLNGLKNYTRQPNRLENLHVHTQPQWL